MKREIGIIGYGRFGEFISKYLKNDYKIFVYDNREKYDRKFKNEVNIHFTSLEEVCSKGSIILSLPISRMESILKQIKDLIKKDTLVIDVCSVKVYPLELMKKNLPESVSILGTHPLFGPDSAKESLKNRKVILCPVRIDRKKLDEIVKYLTKLELNPIISTAEEHDKETAWSLCLTHFFGRALSNIITYENTFDTLTYRELVHIKNVVNKDSMQLFYDMQNYNPFAPEMRKKVLNNFLNIEKELKKNQVR
jgi:prephenate dehydrogenase